MRLHDGDFWREQAAAANTFRGLAYRHAVHAHVCARREIFGCEFVFCGNIGFRRVGLRIEDNLLAFTEIGQRDQQVVLPIELEPLIRHYR